MTEYLCVAIELGLRWSFYVPKKYFYVATDLAKVKRI